LSKLKVAVIVGTRPELIRLARVLTKIDDYCDLTLIHTGQNHDYELNEVFFSELALPRPHFSLETAAAGPAETIGNIISETGRILSEVRPDSVLILGDTNSSLAAIPAKRLKIPVFHMEAGNRCFDMRVPEEINRKIVDHISDVNMPYSDISREYLLREGLPPERVVKTGSPLYEVLTHYSPHIDASDVMARLGLTSNEFFVVSFHREENLDNTSNLECFCDLLNKLVERFRLRIIVSTHPRTRIQLDQGGFHFNQSVLFAKPLGFFDYVSLQKNARAVLSDSGTITEESSILNFPALNLREAHERPEGMEEGAVMMTGLLPERIFAALDILTKQPRGAQRLLRAVEDYQVPNVSEKVVRILMSYTDYVNRVVWRNTP